MEKTTSYPSIIKHKLSQKLLTALGYCLFTVGIITLLLNYYLNYQILETQLETRAACIAQGLEFATEGLVEIGETDLLERVVQNYATLDSVLGILIIDPNGITLASAPLQVDKKNIVLNDAELLSMIAESTKTGVENHLKTRLHGQKTLIHLLPFSSVLFAGNPRRGLAVVMVNIEDTEKQVWGTFYRSIFTLLLGICVILFFILVMINKEIIQPINNIYLAIINSAFNDKFIMPTILPSNEIKFLAKVFQQQFNELKNSNTLLKQEIKDHQKTEEQLRRSQQILQLVMDNIPQGVFWKDCNSIFLGCNKNFLKKTHLSSPAEIIGLTDYDMPWSKEQAEWFRECDRLIMTNNTPRYHIIETLSEVDGNKIWLDTNKVPLHDHHGNVIGILGTFDDITNRKQLEEEREQALVKEKQINEHKTRFIHIVSHEFRNPLTVILASAQLLENYSDKLTAEKKLSHLHNIQKAGNRLRDMISDILVISHTESDKIRLNYQSSNLQEFCLDILQELQLGLGKDHLFIFLEEGITNKNQYVNIDEKILRYILSNILSNAVKYSPLGSQIIFQVEYKEESLVFTVSDHGLGIPSEDQNQVFESFYRGQNIGNISGTGLGLNIVKKCLELCQGQITFTSQLNVGTTFKITIPLKQIGTK